MKIISTFKEYTKLFEAGKSKESWMPSYDEIEKLEKLQKLRAEKILWFNNFRGTAKQIIGGYRAFRSILVGGYEYILTPAIESSGTDRKVNFKYGSYMIERDLPFSTEDEMNLVIDTIFIYSMSIMGIARYDKLKRIMDSGDINSAINSIHDCILKYKTSYSDYENFPNSNHGNFDNKKFYAISELLKLILAHKVDSRLKPKTIEKILYILNIEGCPTELSDILVNLLPDSILDDYISKNPTDIYYLDSMPDKKAGVLRRTGIKDLGKLGKLLKSGML